MICTAAGAGAGAGDHTGWGWKCYRTQVGGGTLIAAVDEVAVVTVRTKAWFAVCIPVSRKYRCRYLLLSAVRGIIRTIRTYVEVW